MHRRFVPPDHRIRFGVFILLGVGFSFLLIEVLSLASLYGLRELRPRLFIHHFIDRHFDDISEEYRVRFVEEIYDPYLGWDNKPSSQRDSVNSAGVPYVISFGPDGSRLDSIHSTNPAVVAIGDSFALCIEVDDHETWPFYLETAIDQDVSNFGVGGYGTGQAILKLERLISEGLSTQIIVLSVFEDNVARSLNAFRPFYYADTALKLGFKPSFRVLKDGRVSHIPNPFVSRNLSTENLRSVAHELAESEYWTDHVPHAQIRYPYTLQLARATFDSLEEMANSRQNRFRESQAWADPEAVTVMHWLINRYLELAESIDATPVIVFIPRGRTLATGQDPSYSEFKAQLRRSHHGMIVIDIHEHKIDRPLFNVRPFSGHASAYGNNAISEIIVAQLADRQVHSIRR